MAVLSPALVIAMCVMFILTRLHAHFYIFEYPFLFNLIYCLEPSPDQLETIAKACSGPANSQSKRKTKPSAASVPPSKQKLSASFLTVRRARLSAAFFTSESEFPHHRQFDHLMAIACGYVAAFLFEETVSCVYPNLLANSRSTYVAAFAMAFALFEAISISIDMSSGKVLLALGALSWIVASCVILAGDFAGFVHFDQAFDSLSHAGTAMLEDNFSYGAAEAAVYARRLALAGRLVIALVSSLISMAVAAPARYFSRLDYGLYCEYREDVADHRDDPYYLGKPTPWTLLKVTLDYVVPALVVFLWAVTPREGGAFGIWRLAALMICVFFRFATLRIRLQSYLDGAIDAYRSFWTDKSAANFVEAGNRTSLRVISNSYYIMMISTAYVAPIIIPLMLVLVAKSDGAVTLGVCPLASFKEVSPIGIFAREVSSFLAWWSIACYVTFAVASLCYEFVAQVLDPSLRQRGMKLPPASSSSERRKQKRMMRQQMAPNQVVA